MSRIPGSSIWWPTTAGAAAKGETVPGVAVLAFAAPLTFLTAAGFAREFLAGVGPGSGRVKLAVLEAAGVGMIDFTAARAVEQVVKACREAGVVFAVARLESVAGQEAFERLGLTELVGRDHIFASVADALKALAPGEPTAGKV
jgi:MFS superfamily sulfate permease-like transporter